MDARRVTLIVSDLHMGDGAPGDDFVDDDHQFAKFVRAQAATREGAAGQMELIINGDFLEFVQVYPQAYRLNSAQYWCTEKESLAKLERILKGHADVFLSLREFQRGGNRVTLFAGNHDVDLYWDDVRQRITEEAGDINFELGDVWYQRYQGRLQISHGHLFDSIDPANGFAHWQDPRLGQPNSLVQRLEMCPGTLFVVKFVNYLEDKYPFADNLHPETALANVLWREDRWALKAVAWVFARFVRQFPKAFLSAGKKNTAEIGPHLLSAVKLNSVMQEKLARVYREVLHEPDVTGALVATRLNSEDALAEFMERLLQTNVPWEEWLTAFDAAKPLTNSAAAPGKGTLAIQAASKIDTLQACVDVARKQWTAGAQIVVLGHTHLPQCVEEDSGRYYNPGSWTRYVDAKDVHSLTLAKLEREDLFPYRLNCVRVEDTGADALISAFQTIDQR
jgi:UDP-2,3-diacylglucosamine pyrophosphatase LpxH